MIFESEELLPNEVILEMTMNAFGYDIDMFEVQDYSTFLNFLPSYCKTSMLMCFYLLFLLTDWIEWQGTGTYC